jgi:hypothetical protein
MVFDEGIFDEGIFDEVINPLLSCRRRLIKKKMKKIELLTPQKKKNLKFKAFCIVS